MIETTSQPPSHNDEIDLFQLIENIWTEKTLILCITLCFLIGGGLFAFLQTPVYQAHINLNNLKPAQTAQLKSLQLYPELVQSSPLDDLIQTLYSSSTKQGFIETTDKEIRKKLYPNNNTASQISTLNNIFSLKNNQTKKNSASTFPYSATFSAPDADLAANELNRLITFNSASLLSKYQSSYQALHQQNIKLLEQKVTLITNTIQRQLNNEITRLIDDSSLQQKTLENNLNAAKKTYIKKLNDQKEILKEAYTTAEALKIIKPIGLKELGRKSNSNIEVDLSGRAEPLYLRGTKLLAAELQQLENRSPDTFPNPEIREIEKKLLELQRNPKLEQLKLRKANANFKAHSPELEELFTQLETLKAENFPDDLTLSFTASPAITPATPLKPKKALILTLSIILGIMIGIITALIRSTLRKRSLNAPT